jgi:hypothetical protein
VKAAAPFRVALPLVALALLPSCGGASRFARDPDLPPPALQAVGPPLSPSSVRVHAEAIGMFTLLATESRYRLALTVDDPLDPVTSSSPHVAIGEVRTRARELRSDESDALECGWRARGAGEREGDPCVARDRTADAEATRSLVEGAIDELRQITAAAGANEVARVACFSIRGSVRRGGARLWCEGMAVAPTTTIATVADAPSPTPPAAPQPNTLLAPARWAIGATAHGGVVGSQGALGAALFLRHRPIELVLLDVESAPAVSTIMLGTGLTLRKELGAAGIGVLASATLAGAKTTSSTSDAGFFSAMLVTPALGLSWQPHASAPAIEPLFELIGGATIVAAGTSPVHGVTAIFSAGLVWPEPR